MRTEPATAPLQRPRPPQGGSLGEALRNLQKYVDQESFNNDKGQVQNLGPLQFDTKGVEFGPWIRRFIAQVRRNWFVPYAAMSLRGHVVLTFYVHRNGALTDVQVIQAVAHRLVQHGGDERAARLESHRAAAAGVPGRQGVLHGHVLLQRVARQGSDADRAPQQLGGLIVGFARSRCYVLLRLAG